MSEHMPVIKAKMVGKIARVSAFLVLTGRHRKYRSVHVKNCSWASLVHLSREVMLFRYWVSQKENTFLVSPNSWCTTDATPGLSSQTKAMGSRAQWHGCSSDWRALTPMRELLPPRGDIVLQCSGPHFPLPSSSHGPAPRSDELLALLWMLALFPVPKLWSFISFYGLSPKPIIFTLFLWENTLLMASDWIIFKF